MKPKAPKGTNNPSRKPKKDQTKKSFKSNPSKDFNPDFEEEDPLLKKKTQKDSSRKKGRNYDDDDDYDDDFEEFMGDDDDVEFNPDEDLDSLDLYEDDDFADDDDYF